MADTQETIADIIAEMRGDGHTGPADALEWVRIKLEYYADRLEAAHRRERGDCAKLREACAEAAESAAEVMERVRHKDRLAFNTANYIEGVARTALAAPPRNCDNLKTSWEVLKEWHGGLATDNDIVRLLDWLLSPATEKEGGNDGR